MRRIALQLLCSDMSPPVFWLAMPSFEGWGRPCIQALETLLLMLFLFAEHRTMLRSNLCVLAKKITPTVQYSIVQYLLARIPSSPSSWPFLSLQRAQNQKNLMLTTCMRGGWWTIAVGWTWIYLEVIWQGLVRVRECTKLQTRFSWALNIRPSSFWDLVTSFFGAQQTFCFWAHCRRSHFPEEAPPFPLRLG